MDSPPTPTPPPLHPAASQPGAARPRPAVSQEAGGAPAAAKPPASGAQAFKERARRLILSPAQPSRPARRGLIFHLEIVLAVAFLTATLFTAWTPGKTNSPVSLQLPTQLPPSTTQIGAALSPAAPPASAVNSRLVGIVAGHWKNDSGAVCADGLKEVDLNLNTAYRVQKLLAEAGYQVEVLQEFDLRLTGFQAAALVSIHNDSCDFVNNEATGFKVAAAFATHRPDRAARLTACLRSRYGSLTGLPVHSMSVTPDMTSYHAFKEIDEFTPAAIIETGFMNLDRTLLTQQPELVAKGVADGILCYLRNESISSAAPTPPTLPASPTP